MGEKFWRGALGWGRLDICSLTQETCSNNPLLLKVLPALSPSSFPGYLQAERQQKKGPEVCFPGPCKRSSNRCAQKRQPGSPWASTSRNVGAIPSCSHVLRRPLHVLLPQGALPRMVKWPQGSKVCCSAAAVVMDVLQMWRGTAPRPELAHLALARLVWQGRV